MESAYSSQGGTERNVRCLDPARVAAKAKKLLVTLHRSGLDLKTKCGRTSCYVARHLPVLNETLYEAAMQLTEHSPGALTLGALRSVDVDAARSDNTVMEAAILLNWLLKHHSCIKRLVLAPNAIPVSCFPILLSDALVANEGLVHILAHPGDYSDICRKDRECSVLAAALAKLSPGLESLDLTPLIIDHHSAEGIASAIRRGNLRRLALCSEMSVAVARRLFLASAASANLSSLEIAGFKDFSKSNARVLATALKRNTTLQKLSVEFTEEAVVGIILASLEHNSTLKELCLASCNHCALSFSLVTLWDGLQALRTNRGLSYVKITGMRFKSSFAMVIADILRENNTLQELNLASNWIGNTGGRALANALKENSSLKRFDLSDNRMAGEALVQNFIDSLALNSRLDYVLLGSMDISEDWVPTWPPAGDVHARLHVTWNTCGLEGYAERLRDDDGFSQRYVGWTFDADSAGVVQWFFAARPACASLTELTIEFPWLVESEICTAVASFLEDTNSLKKLVVVRRSIGRDAFVIAVISGLTCNKSVRDAEFHEILFHPVARAVGTLFRANRTLHRLKFTEYRLHNKSARLLARALEDNFVFLTFEFKHFGERDTMHPLQSLLNRNRSLLNRAVECVLGTAVDSRSVAALELLSSCDSLLDAVSDVSGKTREDSKHLVFEAVRRQTSSSNMNE